MHGFLHLSQTNFLALHFAKTPLFEHYKRMRLNVPIICLILITVFISACSSKPKPKITNTPLETIINDVEISDTATKKLDLADALNSKMPADEKSISSVQTLINNLLIEARELFILEHN